MFAIFGKLKGAISKGDGEWDFEQKIKQYILSNQRMLILCSILKSLCGLDTLID